MRSVAFRTFEDVQDHLDGLGLFHMDFALDRVRRAVATLGLDRPPCFTVQVIGTNGKGSTSTFLASLARAHGLKTGLYTSPHFVTPRERININGRLLPESRWPALACRVHEVAPELTYFEFLTVLGYLAFAEEGVELAVMEAGLGGRYDATTALPAHMLCYTPISLDHQAVLGHTPVAIATDKAGAIRSAAPVFTAPQRADVLDVLRAAAARWNAPLHLTGPDTAEGFALGLWGPHQRINAALALTAWREARVQMGLTGAGQLGQAGAEAAGLAQARIAGRLHWQPPYLLDGAHNLQGLESLRDALLGAGARPSAVIFSCLGDKDVDAMLPILLQAAQGAPFFVPTIQDNERAMLGDELAARLRGLGARACGYGRLSQALAALREARGGMDAAQGAAGSHPLPPHPLQDGSQPTAGELVLVCGSLYLLGEWFTLFPEELEQ